MILVNGEFKQTLEITDRGFQYGDGLFETIDVKNGQPVLLGRHLKRINTGSQRLNIPSLNPNLIETEIRQLCRDVERGIVKLIITRGIGGRGYRCPEVSKPTRILSTHPHPNYPESFQQNGITAIFCNTRLSLNPSLTGLKHLNRLEQVLARAEWNDHNIQEGLMLDMAGKVIEGTMSNLFYIKNNTLFTSAENHCAVAGIMRGLILELAQANGLSISNQLADKHAILQADELFVCNSIIGLWPIKQLAEKTWLVGRNTQNIIHWLNNYLKEQA